MQYHFCSLPANGQIITWHLCKLRYTLSVKLSNFTVWSHTWRKNCAVLTGNSADLGTVLSRRLSRRELLSSFRESHSFHSLPADTMMASSRGTSVSSNSFSRWASHDIFLFKYHFLPYILHFLFFFLDNILADVASKQQTTALFLSTIVTRTRRHTELTKKLTNLLGNLCCAREHPVQFFEQFFTQLTCTVLLRVYVWKCQWKKCDPHSLAFSSRNDTGSLFSSDNILCYFLPPFCYMCWQ